MGDDLKDKWFGLNIQEYLNGLVIELKRDAVGLFTIVDTGRDGYGLANGSLELFVRNAITLLLEEGALPSEGNRSNSSVWQPVSCADNSPNGVCDYIIDSWKSSGSDPNAGDVWFIMPDNM